MFFLESDLLEEAVVTVEPTDMGLDGLEGALIAVSECEEVYYNLREKMMKLEHVAVVNEDMSLLEEGKKSFNVNFGGIFAKLKSMVEELYRKFIDWVTKMFGNDKKFIARFKEDSFASSIQISGYSFAGLEGFSGKLAAAGSKVLQVFSTEGGVASVAKELGVSASSKSELTSALKAHLYGGKEKSNQTAQAGACLSILEKAQGEMSDAKKAKESVQKSLDSLIKAMGKSDIKGTFERDGVDNDGNKLYKSTSSPEATDETKKEQNKRGGAGTKRISGSKDAAMALTTAYGVYISALKDRRSQSRAALVAMMNTKNKADKEAAKKAKEPKEEVQQESFFGILGQI